MDAHFPKGRKSFHFRHESQRAVFGQREFGHARDVEGGLAVQGVRIEFRTVGLVFDIEDNVGP